MAFRFVGFTLVAFAMFRIYMRIGRMIGSVKVSIIIRLGDDFYFRILITASIRYTCIGSPCSFLLILLVMICFHRTTIFVKYYSHV